jgi:peptidoglycan/xylan/chitin deacetylase (PgdA/CDA1 family)
MRLPVIMYHRIGDGDRYCVSENDFARQMSYLFSRGFRSVIPGEQTSGREAAARGVIITFDDGHDSDYAVALPLMKKYGFRGVSFITTGYIGTPGYMTRAMVQSLIAAGFAVHSHTHSHPLLAVVDPVTLRYELSQSRRILTALSGMEVNGLSLPGGSCSKCVIAAANELGYTYVFGSLPSINRVDGPGFYGRMLISSGTSFETFCKIVAPDEWFYARARCAYITRNVIRGVIGAQRYHRLWRRYYKRSLPTNKQG